jgi:hypothetical protein
MQLKDSDPRIKSGDDKGIIENLRLFFYNTVFDAT